MKKIKEIAGKLLFEATAILMGVSVALAVDNWKDDRNDRKEERRLLHALYNEMRIDSVLLHANQLACNSCIATYSRILAQGAHPDSLAQDYDKLISYPSFSPSGNVYREMLNLGHSRLITNDTLRASILLFNTTFKDELAEVVDLDKRFVLDRMIPYLEANMPYPYTAGKASASDARKPHLLNLIQTDLSYKKMQLMMMTGYGNMQTAILAELRKAIGKEND